MPSGDCSSSSPASPPQRLSNTINLLCRPAHRLSNSSNVVSLHYLAEGAANVVFSIRPFSSESSSGEFSVVFVDPMRPGSDVIPSETFHGHVLRVSKGLAKTLDGQKVKDDFDEHIAPLFKHEERGDFREHLMDMELVALHYEVVNCMNEHIAQHGRRQAVTIPTGSVALKMEDMSSVPGQSLSIEIKPKWLEQSNDAPEEAYRCRNCALRALRESKERQDSIYVCPLRLFLKYDEELVRLVVHQKVLEAVNEERHEPLHPRVESLVVRTMTDYIVKGKGRVLTQHLSATQHELDHGILTRPTVNGPMRQKFDHTLRQAMTLRDCSWFIKVNYSTNGEVEVVSKLADLDFKSPDKIDDWVQKERELVDGGWYIGVDTRKWDGCWIAQERMKRLM